MPQPADFPTLLMVVPIVGPNMNYVASRSRRSRGFRLALVVGAQRRCLALTVLLMVVASYVLQ